MTCRNKTAEIAVTLYEQLAKLDKLIRANLEELGYGG